MAVSSFHLLALKEIHMTEPLVDKSIVTIYDTANDNKPLKCFVIDSIEFLGHKSGRWSKNPEGKKKVEKKVEKISSKRASNKEV